MKIRIDHVKQISGGYRHTLMLKDDGTVWAVGGNEHGQLGDGKQSLDISVEPVQVQGLRDVIAVSAGDNHSLALCKDGTVWAWGGNEDGQLGNDSRKNSLNPVQVKGLTSVLAVSAGMRQSAALGNGGEIWVWGFDKFDNYQHIARKPTRLKGGGEYQAIAIGSQYGTALSGNGTVWLWKNEAWVDPKRDTLDPFQIAGLTDVVSISNNSCVKADGTVWRWTFEQDGRPNVSQIVGITNAKAITEGDRNYYVLLNDGHVLSWGWNEFGQAGLGVTDNLIESPHLVPKPIAIYINDKEIHTATPPLIVQGSTYVPLRGIFEKFGINLIWDVQTRSVIATKGVTEIVLNSVTGRTTVNGQTILSEQKPISLNDSIFVPLRLVSETLGAKVKWNASNNTISINEAQ